MCFALQVLEHACPPCSLLTVPVVFLHLYLYVFLSHSEDRSFSWVLTEKECGLAHESMISGKKHAKQKNPPINLQKNKKKKRAVNNPTFQLYTPTV